MARAGKIALHIALILVLMVAGYEAQTFARVGWDSVVEYQSPYLASLPRGSAASPLAQRVVLVLVDGLRLDASQKMPNLNDLRRQGADLAIRVGQPSLSYPSWTAIATGAWQEVSGVTTNWFEGPVRLDNVFRAAKDAGVPAVVVGARGWQKLFGPDIPDFVPVAWPGEGKAPPEEWMRADREACQKGLETLRRFDSGFIYNLLYFVVRRHTWSLSVFNSEAQIEAFFNQRLLDAALSVTVAGLLLALALWRRPPLETLERMVTFSFTAFYLLLLQVDLFYWLYHIRFLWALPDLQLGFKYYMDLLQMIPVGVLSGVLAGLAVLIGWGIRRWRRPRPVPERVSSAPEPLSVPPVPEGEGAPENP